MIATRTATAVILPQLKKLHGCCGQALRELEILYTFRNAVLHRDRHIFFDDIDAYKSKLYLSMDQYLPTTYFEKLQRSQNLLSLTRVAHIILFQRQFIDIHTLTR
jgi:hypothetical protein